MRTTKPTPPDDNWRDGFQSGFQAGFRAGIQGGYQTGYRDGYSAAGGATKDGEIPKNAVALSGAAEMAKMAKRVADEAAQESLPDPGRPRALASSTSPRSLSMLAGTSPPEDFQPVLSPVPPPRSTAPMTGSPPLSYPLAGLELTQPSLPRRGSPTRHQEQSPPQQSCLSAPALLSVGLSPPRGREASGKTALLTRPVGLSPRSPAKGHRKGLSRPSVERDRAPSHNGSVY